MTPEMQKAFNLLQDAIDIAATNGLLTIQAEAMWDAMTESLDDEERITEAYDKALSRLQEEATTDADFGFKE